MYNKIKDSPLKYYENDILNEYKLNSLKSFENIQYSIPMNNNDLTNKIKLCINQHIREIKIPNTNPPNAAAENVKIKETNINDDK